MPPQVPGVIGGSQAPERTSRGGCDDENEKNTTINRGEGEDAGGGDAPLRQESPQKPR